MKYYQKKRSHSGPSGHSARAFSDNDPLTGLANLFDIGLVFIVGLIFTLFTAYHLQDLFSEKSEITLMKKSQSGQLEIITKKGRQIKAMKVSPEKAQGQGQRLGVAYRLQDGTMVYVPEE